MRLISHISEVQLFFSVHILNSVWYNMSTHKDIRLYLWTLKCYGLLSASYERSKNSLNTTTVDELLATLIFCLTQLLTCSLMSYLVLYPNTFHLPVHNKTGNIQNIMDFCFCCVLLSITSFYFYTHRREHTEIVQQILHYNNDCLKEQLNARFFKFYMIYLALGVLMVVNITRGFWQAGLAILGIFICVLIFLLNFLVCGFVMLFYTFVRLIVEHTFSYYNSQLERIITRGARGHRSSYTKIRNVLRRRNQLFWFCNRKLNNTYGLIFLPISSYMMFIGPSGPFFMISVVFELSLNTSQMLQALIAPIFWSVHWLTIFIIAMSTSDVSAEANKTAKILSKIPRSGTGVEKMINKFLLKNLRQKPILTAYGFFSLDKSTLFKLFTAIFTYMVILVQFKEMESSAKQQNT